MSKLTQPELSIPFKLPNGVALKATARARMIKNSHRVDAKTVGIDWDTIYVCVSIDSEEYGPNLFNYIDICEYEGEHYLSEELLKMSAALGSSDYFHIMQNSVFLAVHNLKQLKKG